MVVPSCCWRDDFSPVLSIFFFWFWKPVLLFLANFWLTRATQTHSPSPSAPTAARSGPIGRWWPARGAHAPVGSPLFSSCVGHTPLFSSRSRRIPVVRRRSSVWVAPVSAHGLHPPPSGFSALFLHCRQLVLGGFLVQCCVFFVFFFFFFPQFGCWVQILWEYLLANC